VNKLRASFFPPTRRIEQLAATKMVITSLFIPPRRTKAEVPGALK
jgi:hypothetical protein